MIGGWGDFFEKQKAKKQKAPGTQKAKSRKQKAPGTQKAKSKKQNAKSKKQKANKATTTTTFSHTPGGAWARI